MRILLIYMGKIVFVKGRRGIAETDWVASAAQMPKRLKKFSADSMSLAPAHISFLAPSWAAGSEKNFAMRERGYHMVAANLKWERLLGYLSSLSHFTLPRMFASSSNCAHVPLKIRAHFSLDNGMLLYVMSLARWCSLDLIPEFHLWQKAHTYESISSIPIR